MHRSLFHYREPAECEVLSYKYNPPSTRSERNNICLDRTTNYLNLCDMPTRIYAYIERILSPSLRYAQANKHPLFLYTRGTDVSSLLLNIQILLWNMFTYVFQTKY